MYVMFGKITQKRRAVAFILAFLVFATCVWHTRAPAASAATAPGAEFVELTGDLDVYNGVNDTGDTVRTTTVAEHDFVEAVFGTASWASGSAAYNFSNNALTDYRAAFDSARGDGAAVNRYFDGETQGSCGVIFKEPQIIARVGFQARQAANRLNGAILEGSNDNETYEPIYTIAGSGTASYAYRTAADGVVSNQAYKYVRLRGVSSLGGALNPYELKLYTYASPENMLTTLAIPGIVTTDVALPQEISGYEITWKSLTPEVISDSGVITAPEAARPIEAKITASITFDGETASRTFSLLVFPSDPLVKPTMIAYADQTQSAAVGESVHFATLLDGEVRPLNFGDGILFAPADFSTGLNNADPAYIADYDQNLESYSFGGKRSLANAWFFRMTDGKMGVVAEQRAYDDQLPEGYEKSLFFWTSENLLDYEFKGTITPAANIDEAIIKPQVTRADGDYIITWLSADGAAVREATTTDFVTFTGYNERSSRERIAVPNVIDGVSCVFDVSADEYQYVLKKLLPLENTTAENRVDLALDVGAAFTVDDLPKTFKAYYSDGSEADMPIKWSDDALESFDPNIPGTYTLTAQAAYDQYEYPFIQDRADPDIVFYEGYYYFISTFDASGGGADSYQESLRIRRSETIMGLPDAEEFTIIPYSADARAYKWAPELHVINGRLSILVAIGQERAAWNRQHASIVTLKDGGNPLAAEDWNMPVTIKHPGGTKQLQTNQNGITLDMTYFEDAGTHYYMWSQRFIRGTGTADLYIAKFDPADPSVLTTEPVCLIRPTYGWERPGDSRVQEGPYVLRHDGRMFLTYSGAMVDPTYVVALMEAAQGTDLTDINNWKLTGYPILTTNKVTGQYGPGHNAYIKDEYGRDVIVFHARTSTGGGARHSGVRTVHWAFDGTPVLYMTADRQLKPEYRTFTMRILVTSDTDVAADADALFVTNADDVRGNLYLPNKGASGSYINWASSAPSVVTPTGEVRRPAYGEEDVKVKLTATITNGADTQKREFVANVRAKPRKAPFAGYLLGYFLSNNVLGENIRMSVSEGNTPTVWTPLNDGEIMFTSLLGEMGLRDPFIIRSPEGDKFYMIATDLSIGRNGNWTRAQTHGSLYIEVWESTDLINWSEQRHVKVSPEAAGNTWAPEAYWDDSIGAYVVFWASCLYPEDSDRSRATSNRMMYCTTRDFVTFSEPAIWQDREIATIDSTVIKENGMYYRFTKNESGYNADTNPYGKDMFLEKAASLRETNLESWQMIGENISRKIWNEGTGNRSYEGPVVFKANPGDSRGDGYYYMADNNGGVGYRMAFSRTLDSDAAWTGVDVDWGISANLHHGTVAQLTETERYALLGKDYKVPTSTSLTLSTDTAAYGDPVTLTASVGAQDGAEVAGYVEFSTVGWNKKVKLSGQTASIEITDEAAIGLSEVKARYLGFGEVDASEDVKTLTTAAPGGADVTSDAAALLVTNIGDVKGNLTLALRGATGSKISWASANQGVITTTGEVTRPAYGEDDVTVKLTATVSDGETTLTREFDAVVRSKPRNTPMSGYFLGYFGSNSVDGEQIRFSVSQGNSPSTWIRLNDGAPMLTSVLGTQGLRDPFIIRSPEGDKFYMIATDLSIGRNGNWTAAQTRGSLYIEVWESEDLVNWSEQRHVRVSPDTAGNTWAPEAYWDKSIGAYVVFWASCLYPDGSERSSSTYNRMMCTTTRDFVTFTEPKVWQDDPTARIDTTVIDDAGYYYRFTKNEGNRGNNNPYGKDIFSEKNPVLLDTDLTAWQNVGYDIGKKTWNAGGGGNYEGPIVFKANPGDPNGEGFYFTADNYGGVGYRMSFSPTLGTDTWKNVSVNFGGTIHHGTIRPITEKERRGALGEEYKVPSAVTLSNVTGAANRIQALVTAEDGGEVAGSVTFTVGEEVKTVKLLNGAAEIDVTEQEAGAAEFFVKAVYEPYGDEVMTSEASASFGVVAVNVVVAKYAADGRLLDASISLSAVNAADAGGGKLDYLYEGLDLELLGDVKTIKVFVWEKDTFAPLTDAYVVG